ncbi:hypothetical protein CEP66_03520 [Citrobacter koseri]|nr:hypothetical protein CEP66_03520 [Citrobacter koseri]ATF96054.1 hypothetical protein CO700_02885 [Citrobacter koseri]AVE67251.1 hypothetical protein AM351_05240 [Citrobacter koseri]PNN14332.1 hypothetical protein AL526_017335 [Citrobacter koseri]
MSHNIECFSWNEGCGQLWDIAYNLHYHTCHSMPCLTPQTHTHWISRCSKTAAQPPDAYPGKSPGHVNNVHESAT